MPERYTQIIILCEDRQQSVFARHFLVSMGIADRYRIRNLIAPSGEGSAEQYVRETLAKEVRTYRSRSGHLHIALAVLTDADTLSVTDRINQLESALADASLPKREARERIAFFIPKRNIETWIHYLMGEQVNENKSYPKFGRESECKTDVRKLAENCKKGQDIAYDAPSSLKTACRELERIIK